MGNFQRWLWHYTVGDHAVKIVEMDLLRPATAFIPEGERPAVWFSTRERWEPTAAKLWETAEGVKKLDMEGTARHGGGLVRFGVAPETAPHSWADYRRMSGVDPKIAKGLERTAKKVGSYPDTWFVSFEPVPGKLWTAIDVWRDDKWVRVHPQASGDRLTSSELRKAARYGQFPNP